MYLGYLFGANSYSANNSYVPLSLTTVIITGSTAIGNYAFYNCTSIENITLPDSVSSVGNYTFYGCTALTCITVGSGNTAYKTINGNLYSYDGTELIQYAVGKTDTSFIIPDGVSTINDYAFYGCYALTDITIADSVTNIAGYAFYGCTALSCITVGSGNTAYKSVDGNLYSYDGTTLIIYAVGNTDTSFIIPDDVTSISSYAFYNCNLLTTVTIGNKVTSVGINAFSNCSSLTAVYYYGTAEEWNNIKIGSGNNNLTSATIYYYSEETPAESGSYWHYVEGVATPW